MLDTQAIVEDKIKYQNQLRESNPNCLNNFDGTFQISDHTRIAEELIPFLMVNFKTAKIRRIPLEDINNLLNEVWEGPGSMEKILRMTHELWPHVNIAQLDAPTKKPLIDVGEDDGPVASYGDEGFASEESSD